MAKGVIIGIGATVGGLIVISTTAALILMKKGEKTVMKLTDEFMKNFGTDKEENAG